MFDSPPTPAKAHSSPHLLRFCIYPSPFGVDWRSPHHLARSVALNTLSFRPRTIGHVAVELVSPVIRQRWFTGMTAKRFSDDRNAVLKDQFGLGIVFHSVEGKMETPDHLDPERQKRLKSGHFSVIEFEIKELAAVRVDHYLSEYQNQGLYRWYGLPNRPRYREGGGCSAFAVSVLEIAGLMKREFYTHWQLSRRVPADFLGNAHHKVPVWKLLSQNRKTLAWASPHQPGLEIQFWDPDCMHRWVLNEWSNPKNPQENWENAPILRFDATTWTTPTDALFKI